MRAIRWRPRSKTRPLAPELNAALAPDDDSTKSARAELIAFVNGQAGAQKP